MFPRCEIVGPHETTCYVGVHGELMMFIEENVKFPMNLISMLLYDGAGGLLCMKLIGVFLEKMLVSKT